MCATATLSEKKQREKVRKRFRKAFPGQYKGAFLFVIKWRKKMLEDTKMQQ